MIAIRGAVIDFLDLQFLTFKLSYMLDLATLAFWDSLVRHLERDRWKIETQRETERFGGGENVGLYGNGEAGSGVVAGRSLLL